LSRALTTGSHTFYLNCTDTANAETTALYYYYYDPDHPIINSGSPLPFNTTTYTGFTMNIVGNVTNINLSKVNTTIYYPNSTVFYNNLTTVFGDPTFHDWDWTFNTTTEPNGVWSMDIYAEDLIPNSNEMFISFTVNNCIPNWQCGGYGVCNTSDLAPCINATDTNNCGLPYGGDLSEFSPQNCDYCTPDWQRDFQECISHIRQINWTDLNFATCCNVTLLSSDCDNPYANEEACSMFDYEESDLPKATVDVIVKFILGFGVFVAVFVFGFVGIRIYRWFRK